MKLKLISLTISSFLVSCTSTVQTPLNVSKSTIQSNDISTLTNLPIDDFYTIPTNKPSNSGEIIKISPLSSSTLPNDIKAWRILYTTTINDKTPATAVAIIFQRNIPNSKPSPVIIWEHGTTGLLQKCMPSLVSMPTMGMPAVEQAIKSGWTIVATDYSFTEKDGAHPYLIGEGEARAGLDSVRAAAKIKELNLDLGNTVVWGHSQGGHASLWTGIIAPSYAQDINLKGVVAIAPAANILNIMTKNKAAEKRLGPYIASSYSHYYPDIDFETAIRPEALKAAYQIKNLCGFLPTSDPAKISELTKSFQNSSLNFEGDPNLLKRLNENHANKKIQAPILVTQGLADVVVRPEFTDEYVNEQCQAGQKIEYLRFKGKDHGTIVSPGSSLEQPLIQWTLDRFNNKEFTNKCSKKDQ